MIKHLTLLLFIGLAWGQSLKEMVEFNKCSKIEDELERLECYAKLVDINNPDSTEILLLKNFDRITKENYFDESEYKIVENWIITESIDPLDDSKTITMRLESVSGKNNYGDKIDLIIRCKSFEIDLFIDWGVYLGSDVLITSRIGKDKAKTGEWSISTDKKASFSYNPVSLARSLAIAERYVAKVTPYNESPIVAVFDLKGLSNAIKTFDGHCNLEESDAHTLFIESIYIENVIKLGNKTTVIINGKSFGEGDKIIGENNYQGYTIKSIDFEKITFEKDGITFSVNVGEPGRLYSEDNDLITAEIEEILIENLVSMGDKGFALINGQVFRTGDTLFDGIIEKVDDAKVTIRIGDKLIFKDAGSKIKYISTLEDGRYVHRIKY